MDKFEIEVSKKLESIKSEIIDKDWERFNKKFTEHKPPVLKLAVNNIYKIAATLLITSLLFYSTAQYLDIKSLKAMIVARQIESKNLRQTNTHLQQKIETFEAIVEAEPVTESTEIEQITISKKAVKVESNNAKLFKNKPITAPKVAEKKKAKLKFFQRIKLAVSKVFSKKDSTKRRTD